MKYRKIFKVEAEGDTVYINADNQMQAKQKLEKIMGSVPESMMQWSEVDLLPEGEIFL